MNLLNEQTSSNTMMNRRGCKMRFFFWNIAKKEDGVKKESKIIENFLLRN